MKVFTSLILALFISGGFYPTKLTKAPKKPFEGTITYSIEYIEVPEEVKGMESMLPKTTKMTLRGDMIRVEQEVMGGKQVVISNTTTSESHVLMNMMGQKLAIYISAEDAKAEQVDLIEPKVVDLPGNKTILGYKCKKAEVLTGVDGQVQTLYYTKKLDIKHQSFKSLEGFPLEYFTIQNDMTLRMTASKIEKENVSAVSFEVPEGYQIMTMAEMAELMGGN